MQSKTIDGILEVFEDGTVYRLKDGTKEKITPFLNGKKKYPAIKVYVNGKQTNYYIHRLVANAFLPNPEGLPIVRHKDGNNSNNHVSNLRWATQSELSEDNLKALKKTMESKKSSCIYCEQLTWSKDKICPDCRLELIKKQKQDERNAKIVESLKDIDKSILSDRQRLIVELRLQYMSYGEIAEELGCSRQYIEQEIRRAIVRNSSDKVPVRKSDIRRITMLKNKIAKKESKLRCLENEKNVLEAELSKLEEEVKALEVCRLPVNNNSFPVEAASNQ